MKNKAKSKPSTYSNFIEISIDPTLFNNFSNDQGFSSALGSLATSEEFQTLRNELVRELLIIIETQLTDTQREIVKMTYIEGKTQMEISSILGTHQTAIHKGLCGNLDYSSNRKRYGGALKKIRKLCAKNPKIQEILNRIREKNEECSDH